MKTATTVGELLSRYQTALTDESREGYEIVQEIEEQLAALGIEAEIQGKSFLPLLDQNAKASTPWREAAYYHYYEFPEPHHVYPHFGVRTKRYKLVRFYGGINTWELFDLEKDPHEIKNIYGEKSNEAIVKSLKQQLKILIVQYKDEEALKLFGNGN